MENVGFTNRGVKVNDFLVINVVKSQGVSSALIETALLMIWMISDCSKTMKMM